MSSSARIACLVDDGEWRQLRAAIWRRIARLQAGGELAGSVEQLRQLVKDVDVFVLLLRLDRAPSTADLSRSCNFATSWPTREELGKRLRALPHSYRRAVLHARPTPESLGWS
jgi:hypothetical protein